MENEKKITASIRLDSIKDSDGWFDLANDLGIKGDDIYDIFEFGEYGSITIEVDSDLNIVGGKIHRVGH